MTDPGYEPVSLDFSSDRVTTGLPLPIICNECVKFLPAVKKYRIALVYMHHMLSGA